MKRQILHAKHIDSMQTETLIKDINRTGQSEWRKQVNDMAEELNVKVHMPVLTKNSMKKLLQEEINSKLMDEIDRETEEKTKIKHWREMKTDIKVGKRTQYMEKLTRKQCNAILKARASMLPVKKQLQKWMQKGHPVQILQHWSGNPRTHPPKMPWNREKNGAYNIQQNIPRRSRRAGKNS